MVKTPMKLLKSSEDCISDRKEQRMALDVGSLVLLCLTQTHYQGTSR